MSSSPPLYEDFNGDKRYAEEIFCKLSRDYYFLDFFNVGEQS
jgi:hypothetical protein